MSADTPDEPPGGTTVTTLRPVEMLTADASIERLQDAADAVDRHVMEGLSQQLGLSRSDRAAEVRELSKSIERERRDLRGKIRRTERAYHAARRTIESDLLVEWPEMAGAWNPDARRLVNEQPGEFVGFIESHDRFDEFDRLAKERIEREAAQLGLERRWAKCQRLLQVLETVALEHNLPLAADTELAAQFERLRTAESSTLHRVQASPAVGESP